MCISQCERQSGFFVGACSTDLMLTPCYCQCAYFLKGLALCGSLLCQGFLAKILICPPSRLQSSFSFVWLELCGHWEKASCVLSPFQDILSPSLWYSIKTTHYTAAPRPVPQISTADYCWTSCQFSLPVSTPVPGAFRFFFFLIHFTSASSCERSHLKHPLAHKHADEITGRLKHGYINLLDERLLSPPPQATALWLLVTIVRLCSQALTSGDNGHGGKEESACTHAQIHEYKHKHICRHQKNKQTCVQIELEQRQKTHNKARAERNDNM